MSTAARERICLHSLALEEIADRIHAVPGRQPAGF
jgi:hypothetical protein